MRWLLLLVLWLLPACAMRAAPPLTLMATQPGQVALDAGATPGNPFATALLEALSRPDLPLKDLPTLLEQRTLALSEGSQRPDVPMITSEAGTLLGQPGPGEQRIALVLVMSSYDWGLPPLAGATFDAERIAGALRQAGFRTRLLLDPSAAERDRALEHFGTLSEVADVALIYSTGHGVEVDGVGYLLNLDYSPRSGRGGLESHAIRLARLPTFLRARAANLFLFGGCRNDPWLDGSWEATAHRLPRAPSPLGEILAPIPAVAGFR